MRIKRSLCAIIATTLIIATPLAASAQVGFGVGFTIGTPPPPLPVYSQPAAPYPNWQWQPGYWAWGPAGYYWVPGTWVAPPAVGMYWTPGYWGYNNGYYGWNAGYWGASVGFYGGINYGFGYPGTGFYGGTWGPGGFAYNTAVANVNRTVIHNTYNKTVINKNVCNNCKNVSYNGGRGGISARPTQAQINARRDGRPPTTAQIEHERAAAQDRNLAYSVNHGKPSVTALQKPVTDPKAIPHSAPVTAADRHVAQAEAANNRNASVQHNASTEEHHNAAMAQPHHNATMTESNHAAAMAQPHRNYAASQSHHYAQPPSGAMHSSYGQSHPERPPSGSTQGRPPESHQSGKPPSGRPI
jgi:hypothetical protein